MTDALLALNAGSSSLKFVIAPVDDLDTPALQGSAERLGSEDGILTVRKADGEPDKRPLPKASHADALTTLFDALQEHCPDLTVRGVGHRIVHGGATFTDPVRITPEVVEALNKLVPLAPLHQPHGLSAIAAARTRFPDATQVACFDTAFHAGKPWVHQALALPKRYFDEGVRRYGFHGIACDSITTALIADGFPLDARAIAIAHLGNGCSVTAVKNGRALATSMGFSALDGLTMGTRCGHMDPGVLLHLLRSGHDVESLERLLYRESGLLGLSGMSNDMRDLAASPSKAAKAAIEYFIARTVEEICRMAGVMGGLDCVVFSGGIGENSTDIREAIADGLAFLPGKDGQGVEHRVQPANEERELMRATKRFV